MSKKFLSYSSSSTSGSMTEALVQVIPWNCLQVKAQFKPAFLQEQLIPRGPLQPQHITLSRSGRLASVSVIIGVYILFSITHPHLFYIIQLFQSLILMINSKPMINCCLRRWWNTMQIQCKYNVNTIKRCEAYSKLTKKKPERRQLT